jgi:uncharacterized protein
MTLITLIITLFTCLATSLSAQTKPYNVVFDLTSKDTNDQKTVIRWMKGITETNSSAKLEVVLYGQSLNMITEGKSIVANDVKNLISNKNISFVVCEASMKRNNVERNQLLPGVETVPDGIYEIITKQGEGWGYIKVAH